MVTVEIRILCPEAACHARREGAAQVSPATFDNLQDVESVRMVNADVNGRQTTREAPPANYLPSLS
jgi:hypothetical protein